MIIIDKQDVYVEIRQRIVQKGLGFMRNQYGLYVVSLDLINYIDLFEFDSQVLRFFVS